MILFSPAVGDPSMSKVLTFIWIFRFGVLVYGDDCRVIQFKAGTKNKILTKHVIRSEQAKDKDICELKCYFEPNCVSYNYGPLGDGTFTCELSNRTHLQVSPSYFEYRNDFLYRAIINSCESNPCVSNSTCQAGFGSHGYRCICSDGYEGELCQIDTDECTSSKHDCSSDGDCVNVVGSYQCSCESGFTGDGKICQDIDECNDGSHDCHFAADCTNTAGSFDCSCQSGHLGDGRHFCSDNLKKVNIDPVCFGTKNDDHGTFDIQEAGQVYTFKLVHTSGSVTCDTNRSPTKWGCLRPEYGNYNLMTVITYSNKTVLPLAEFVKSNTESKLYTYQLDGADVNSPTLVFNFLPMPLVVSVGQQFQIWYAHDLVGYTENNNDGETCADVYALYPLN